MIPVHDWTAALSPIGEQSQAEAAELLNVGKRTVERAREVLERGVPELLQAVECGEVSVSAAADVSGLPKREQTVIVAHGEKEILEVGRIRARHAEERGEERMDRLAQISAGNERLNTTQPYPVIYAAPPWRHEFAYYQSATVPARPELIQPDDAQRPSPPESGTWPHRNYLGSRPDKLGT